jgi:hypothetical protein
MVLQRPVYRIERECLSALVAYGPVRHFGLLQQNRPFASFRGDAAIGSLSE